MPVLVGNVVEGTVTGITNFGAFIQLPEGKTGLVHISEISHDYVNNVSDYLKKDQAVKVKILSISDEGKISLSIRQAEPKKSKTMPVEIDWNKTDDKQKFMSFEDKMAKFLKDSSEKQEQIKKKETKKGFGAKSRRA
ncbi:S1 RNA-binding domain-containing protein [Proteiniborus sp. MB09-C3]|uniref:S1 RNA-binding domain-containing protein n=1 Tax=Proteiniborus sp. MB09-C3 TaxID=3050072 RepID=UPI002557B3C2|nr:S1 RNA-binding domain-containing protein [Proteiniborus sp. MB09-C3]WIV13050.1 S1 RNA-binding domain-containing protein [Proteiniborus sp. MB09-C3]